MSSRDGRNALPGRGRRTHRQAAVEAGEAGAAPGLGALNRQLNLVMTQLTTAQRLLGWVAAERDAIRQQLADLQGVPVEDIVIPSVGTPTEDAPVTDAVGPQRDVAPSEASRARGRIDRIRRRLPSRRRSQNAPRS